MNFQKTAILGGSRGLGLSLTRQSLQRGGAVLVMARHQPDVVGEFLYQTTDFSKTEEWDSCLEQLKSFQPDRVIYCAAGGPFGEFSQSHWKSHQWSLQVSFLTPARLLHELWTLPSLKQFVLIGSSIAEDQPDIHASSYCASKHALKGLHATLSKERGQLDVRLYSPGYMDTGLLPKGSWPRKQNKPLWSPDVVAEDLLGWSEDEQFRWDHKCLSEWADDAAK